MSATPSGEVYVGGETTGNLSGANAGGLDSFVAKYDKNGNQKWIRQFGTAADDAVTDVAVTARGDVYVVGTTDGTLNEANLGSRDGFIAKYDKNGNRKWLHHIGSAGYDEVRSVAVTSSGDAYLTGFTSGSLNEAQQGDNDSFVAKYDRNGKRKWLHQFGSGLEERGSSIAVTPNGNSYAVGYTYGNPSGDDALGDLEGYVVSFDKNGKRRWIRLISTTGIDDAVAVSATAAGDVYVGGSTTGTLNEAPVGIKDAFIARFTSAGVRTWVHQFGAALNDFVEDIATTSNGDAFVVGITTGSLNETNLAEGSFDPFITRYTRAGDRAWFRQFGTSSEDLALSVAVTPAGDAYVGGYTGGGALTDAPSAGGHDAFLTKYSATTTRTWLHALSTPGYEGGYGVASTASGDLYVVGKTSGNLAAGGGGGTDVFLAKYDKYGNQKWVKQFGSAASDGGTSVAVTARGDVYISGYTNGALVPGGSTSGDAFVAKYDKNGNRKWVKQFGTTDFDEGATGVAVDGRGNAYVTGYSEGSLNETNPNPGGGDAFIAKYDKNGNRKWVHQLGSSGVDYANSVAVTSAGDAYIGGYTDGVQATSDGSGQDAFIAKYDKNGNRKWVRQSTSGVETIIAVAIGRSGSVVVAGSTSGVLAPDSPLLGSGQDAFLANYDKNGNRKWVQQFGSALADQMMALAVTSNGDIYAAGSTAGVLPGGVSAGQYDVAVARLDKNGTLIWAHQFGSSGDDDALGITVTAKGGITVVGSARARLNEPTLGSGDAYITRLPY